MNTSETTIHGQIDTVTHTMYNEDTVRQIAEDASHQADANILTRLMSGEAILDSNKCNTSSKSDKRRNRYDQQNQSQNYDKRSGSMGLR